MNYIKVPLKNGGFTYFAPGDAFTFTQDGRAYGYPSNRQTAIELDPVLFAPTRLEAVIAHQNKKGWAPLVDMTKPGVIIYTTNPEEPEVVLDSGVAQITEAGQATDGLAANLAAAGFQVKAPQ